MLSLQSDFFNILRKGLNVVEKNIFIFYLVRKLQFEIVRCHSTYVPILWKRYIERRKKDNE